MLLHLPIIAEGVGQPPSSPANIEINFILLSVSEFRQISDMFQFLGHSVW